MRIGTTRTGRWIPNCREGKWETLEQLPLLFSQMITAYVWIFHENISPKELCMQKEKGNKKTIHWLQLDFFGVCFFFPFPAEQPTENENSVYVFSCKKITIICHEKVNVTWKEIQQWLLSFFPTTMGKLSLAVWLCSFPGTGPEWDPPIHPG